MIGIAVCKDRVRNYRVMPVVPLNMLDDLLSRINIAAIYNHQEIAIARSFVFYDDCVASF
jgi:hypothetical protein